MKNVTQSCDVISTAKIRFQNVALTVSNVTNAGSETLASATVNFRTLLGDVNGNGVVSNTDIASVKAQVSAPVTASNFRADVNANGVISNTDVSATKAQVGTALP